MSDRRRVLWGSHANGQRLVMYEPQEHAESYYSTTTHEDVLKRSIVNLETRFNVYVE